MFGGAANFTGLLDCQASNGFRLTLALSAHVSLMPVARLDLALSFTIPAGYNKADANMLDFTNWTQEACMSHMTGGGL